MDRGPAKRVPSYSWTLQWFRVIDPWFKCIRKYTCTARTLFALEGIFQTPYLDSHRAWPRSLKPLLVALANTLLLDEKTIRNPPLLLSSTHLSVPQCFLHLPISKAEENALHYLIVSGPDSSFIIGETHYYCEWVPTITVPKNFLKHMSTMKNQVLLFLLKCVHINLTVLCCVVMNWSSVVASSTIECIYSHA